MATDHYAAVPGPDGASVVVVDGRLPCVATDGRMPDVLEAFEPAIGRPTYLRLAARSESERLHVFETADAAGLLPLADADPAKLAPPPLRPALAQWLAEQRGAPVPDRRQAWARPGWHAEAEAWVGTPLELVRKWPLSAVLRAGTAYFKAVFPLFRAEPAVTEALAREHPGAVPSVLRTDPERGWLLMEEVTGTPLFDLPADEWAPALRALGGIHRAWSTRTDELLGYGAQDRRTTSALPETLAHGDLNPGNAFLEAGRAVIFDWSDACVADPMIDVHLLLFWVEDESVRAALVDAYAEGWTGELTADEVRSAFVSSEANAYLHQAESYRAIQAALAPDDRWWFDGEEARWLERASAVRAGRRPSRDT